MRVFAFAVVLLTSAPTVDAAGLDDRAVDISGPVASASPATGPDDTTPTGGSVNEFLPEERSLGDCLSSLPKPDCGSDARGGWRQTIVLVLIVAGLAFIVWRIVVQSRKARS